MLLVLLIFRDFLLIVGILFGDVVWVLKLILFEVGESGLVVLLDVVVKSWYVVVCLNSL